MSTRDREYDAHRRGATWRFVVPGERVRINGVVFDVMSRDFPAPGVAEFEIRAPDGTTKRGRPKLDSIADVVNPAPEHAAALLTVRLGAEVLADSREATDAAGMTIREWMCPALDDMSRKARESHLLTFHDTYAAEYEGNLAELHARTPSVVNHAHRS